MLICLIDSLIIFLGEKELNQFLIGDPTFHLKSNGSKLEVEFTLQRNPSHLFINSYLPSFSTMVMTIVPLFLNEQIHFGTTIKLVLTAQLCLYTLFQSSLADIPKTAYLKHIDFWNMLVLLISLINFFTLLIWEIFQQSKIQSKIKFVMRIGTPLAALILVSIYWITAGMLYFGLLS